MNKGNINWISVKDKPVPEVGAVIVYLAKEMLGMRIHTGCDLGARFGVIGGRFMFDAPEITHWAELPEAPEDK